ncbi:MAG TPA: hypothetical protein VIV11_23010 [Kofleriaceae bacterium]
MDSKGHTVTSRVDTWQTLLRPYAILAIGWTLFELYAYPGLMSPDSFDQLEEARAHFYTDSHPPTMAALWSIVDRIIPGPFGMLLIQSLALLSGLYLIMRRVLSPTPAALSACVVFLFPPVMAPMIAIWKDCLMAGFLVLGIAWITDARKSRRALGLFACFVATAMRYNALAATLPLIVLLFEWQPVRRWYVRYAIAVGAWLGVTLLALGLNAALTDRKMHFWYSSYALADITGTLANVDGTIPDEELRPLLAPTQITIDRAYHDTLRARYRADTFLKLLEGNPLWRVPIRGTKPAPVEQRDAIGHAWSEIVSSHVGAYVCYRFQAFHEVLGLPEAFVGHVFRPHWQTRERLVKMGIPIVTSSFQRTLDEWIHGLGTATAMFRPWIYMLLSILLLPFARRSRLVLAVLCSGLVMELSLLALAITADYRYSHWLVICTCISVVLLVAQRSRDGMKSRPEPIGSKVAN